MEILESLEEDDKASTMAPWVVEILWRFVVEVYMPNIAVWNVFKEIYIFKGYYGCMLKAYHDCCLSW